MNNLARKLDTEPYSDKPKAEIIDGIITFMSPGNKNHAETGNQIFRILSRHQKRGGCRVYMENFYVRFDKDNKFIPDVMVVCDRSKIKGDGVHGAPDLIVEVLSRSTVKNDRTRKMHLYGENGVPEYWIVDADKLSIEVYYNHDGKMELDEIYIITPEWERKHLAEIGETIPPTAFTTPVLGGVDVDLYEVFEDIVEEMEHE